MTDETVTNNDDVVENNDDKQSPNDNPTEQYSQKDIDKKTEGMSAEEAAATRRALEKANKEAKNHRLKAKELETEVSRFKELGVDPDEIKEWMEERKESKRQQEEAEMKRLEEEKQFEEIKQRLKQDKEESVKKERERITQLEEQLSGLYKERESDLIEKEVMHLLTPDKLDGTYEFIMPYLSKEVKVQEVDGKNQAVVLDEYGDPRKHDGGKLFTIEDRLKEMREDKVFGKAFGAPKVSGSGSNPSGKSGNDGKGRVPKVTKSELRKNPGKLEAFITTYGMEAYSKLDK